jgi:phosphonate transport system substrate-binding protein
MIHFRLLQFVVWSLLVFFPCGGEAADNNSYILAVPTQLSPLEMYHNWQPFVERLSKEVGVAIRLKVYDTISEYEADVVKGAPDFVFMNPYLLVATKKTQGYIPLIREKSPLVGILVVRKDSSFRSVKDLDSANIAFPTPNAFAASLYMRALLIEKEKIRFTPHYVKTHGNVYRNVIIGKTAAGGGVNKSLNVEKDGIKSLLRILYQTPGFAPHPLSAHPRVPKKLRDAVVDAVLRLAAQKTNQNLLDKINMPEPVRTDYQKDYASLETLNIDKYYVAGEE